MLKIELERGFKSISFYLALIIAIGISCVNLILEVFPRAENPILIFNGNFPMMPSNVFNTWLGGTVNFESSLLVRIIPLLAVLPFSATYYTDKKNGIVKNYYVRVKKKDYLLAKYVTVFLTGGIVCVAPFILNLFVSAIILPSLTPEVAAGQGLNVNALWSEIFYTKPYLYVFLFMGIIFIFSGLLACLTLLVSNFANNRFVALAFPFLLCMLLNMILNNSTNIFIRCLAPSRILDIRQMGPNYGPSIIFEIVFLLILTVTVFVGKGVQDDTL